MTTHSQNVLSSVQTLLDETLGEDIQLVERIRDKRIVDDDVQYLVKWYGNPEPTWEEHYFLHCPDAIKSYEVSQALQTSEGLSPLSKDLGKLFRKAKKATPQQPISKEKIREILDILDVLTIAALQGPYAYQDVLRTSGPYLKGMVRGLTIFKDNVEMIAMILGLINGLISEGDELETRTEVRMGFNELDLDSILMGLRDKYFPAFEEEFIYRLHHQTEIQPEEAPVDDVSEVAAHVKIFNTELADIHTLRSQFEFYHQEKILDTEEINDFMEAEKMAQEAAESTPSSGSKKRRKLISSDEPRAKLFTGEITFTKKKLKYILGDRVTVAEAIRIRADVAKVPTEEYNFCLIDISPSWKILRKLPGGTVNDKGHKVVWLDESRGLVAYDVYLRSKYVHVDFRKKPIPIAIHLTSGHNEVIKFDQNCTAKDISTKILQICPITNATDYGLFDLDDKTWISMDSTVESLTAAKRSKSRKSKMKRITAKSRIISSRLPTGQIQINLTYILRPRPVKFIFLKPGTKLPNPPEESIEITFEKEVDFTGSLLSLTEQIFIERHLARVTTFAKYVDPSTNVILDLRYNRSLRNQGIEFGTPIYFIKKPKPKRKALPDSRTRAVSAARAKVKVGKLKPKTRTPNDPTTQFEATKSPHRPRGASAIGSVAKWDQTQGSLNSQTKPPKLTTPHSSENSLSKPKHSLSTKSSDDISISPKKSKRSRFMKGFSKRRSISGSASSITFSKKGSRSSSEPQLGKKISRSASTSSSDSSSPLSSPGSTSSAAHSLPPTKKSNTRMSFVFHEDEVEEEEEELEPVKEDEEDEDEEVLQYRADQQRGPSKIWEELNHEKVNHITSAIFPKNAANNRNLRDLKAASVPRMMEFICFPTSVSHDPSFLPKVLLIYRTIGFTPYGLFKRLTERYYVPAFIQFSLAAKIRKAVANCFLLWLSLYPLDFMEDNLLELTQKWVEETLLPDGLSQLAQQILTIIRLRIKSKVRQLQDDSFLSDTEAKSKARRRRRARAGGLSMLDALSLKDELPISQQLKNRVGDMSFSVHSASAPPIPRIPTMPPGGKKLNVLQIDEREFAQQLTIVDSFLWNKIQPKELFGLSWSKKNKNELAPNIIRFINQFNKVANWVAVAIVSVPSVRQRAKVLGHIIEIAHHLHMMQNYNSLMAFMGALANPAVDRLVWTMRKVKKHTLATWDSLDRLTTSQNRFSALRTAVKTGQPPVIPYLGIYLTDLTFLEDGSPDYVKGLINFQKATQLHEIVSFLMEFDKINHNFIPVDEIQTFIDDLPQMSEEQLFDTSMGIEPLNAKRQDII